MIELCLWRHRSSNQVRSSVTRWVGRFEAMESRVLLSGNGLVGVPAEFIGGPGATHTFTVTSVPQDPNNTGFVPTTAVTAVGNVVGPFDSSISSVHTTLVIQAIENGTIIGSVTWDVSNDPDGTTSGPSYFGQGPAQDEAVFSLPFTLQSATSATQDVTFKITSNLGSAGVVLQSNGTTPLTGTFVVKKVGPTVVVDQPTTPRDTPVPSIDVSFSQPIVASTFTTAALTLTNNGTPVPLGPDVTFTTTDDTAFTIGGLAPYTTALGSYVFTVSAAGVTGQNGLPGTGSQSVSFTVQSVNAPPTILSIAPVTTPRTDPVTSVNVTFSKPLNPTTFTIAALTLTRDGVTVPLGPDVTFTSTDNQTFTIGNLAGYTAPLGSYVLTINAASVTDTRGNHGEGSQSVDFTVQAPDTGPRVVGLQRYGFHDQPQLLVLTFNEQLDPDTAGNPNNYLVYSPGRNGYIGSPQDVLDEIMTGYYNSTNNTVTLVMAEPLRLSQLHRIIVVGTGPTAITDVNGVALDGQSNGVPGSNYSTIFGRGILVGPTYTGDTITSPPTKKIPPYARPFQHYQIGP